MAESDSVPQMSNSNPQFVGPVSTEEGYSDNIKQLMAGFLEDLPEKNAKVVRIFVSSTFSDMHTERNVLMQKVYPQLKQLCREQHGFEFQMVDMRWGIQDGASLDHMASQICFNEMENCYKLSTGPYFLGILSHRYGSRELPHQVSQAHLQLLQSQMVTSGCFEAEQKLLQKWYELDENQLPPVYILRPILEVENGGSRDHAMNAWAKDSDALKSAIWKCVAELHSAGSMTESDALQFTASVTHLEFELGVMAVKAARRRDALLFRREVEDVRNRLSENQRIVQRFIDTNDSGQVDEQLASLLHRLKFEDLPSVLPEENVVTYSIAFSSIEAGGTAGHSEYVNQLQKDLQQQLERLIMRAVSQQSAMDSDPLYTEVLQHSHQCVSYVRQFQGRAEVMQRLAAYIEGDGTYPLVVFGQSGCGKTSVLAKAGTLLRRWLPEACRSDAIAVIRFLGTSPSSSSILHVLKSVCQQLAVFLGQAESELISKLEEVKEIEGMFYNFLESLAKTRKIVIILDSLDQLDSTDGAYHLSWLRTQLPPNVKIIVSTLPDRYSLLHTLHTLLPSHAFVEVQPLEPQVCSDIVQQMLQSVGRSLTESQWQVVSAAFEQCSLPIFMTLVHNQVVSWRSHTPAHADAISHTVRAAISELFQRLERKYGRVLVTHSLSYITASKSGIGEAELEDLLSLDEDVLKEVFSHHLPPFIRIPPLCWTRIRQEIGSYLVEREADATRVIFWYHRQFWEVAEEYLLADERFTIEIHSRIADYFLGRWSNRAKPFECPPSIAGKLKRQGNPIPTEADRQVPDQPLILVTVADGTQQRYNLRKLNELPHHLILSRRFEEFENYVAFNADFLETKLLATSRHQLLQDLQKYIEVDEAIRGKDSSVEKLFNALRIAALSLNHNLRSLAVDACGRLSEFSQKSAHISSLLQQFRVKAKQNHTQILPVKSCFDSGSGFTHCSLQVQLAIGKMCDNGAFYVSFADSNRITWYDINGNELKSIMTEKPSFLHLRYVPVLPRSGCIVMPMPDEDGDRDKVKLWQANMSTGAWKLLLDGLPAVIPKKYFEPSNCAATAENHVILRSESGGESGNFNYLVIKVDPFRAMKLLSLRDNKRLWCQGDHFVFFGGSACPLTIDRNSSKTQLDEMLQWDDDEQSFQILFLESFELVPLDLPEITVTDQTQLGKAFRVVDTQIIIATVREHPEQKNANILALHLFEVGQKSVQKVADAERELPATSSLHPFAVTVARNNATTAILFQQQISNDSIGFLWRAGSSEQESISLSWHPSLLMYHSLKKGDYDTGFYSPLLTISDDATVVIGSAVSAMFNIWSGIDGSFLRTIPGPSDNVILGQPRGTEYFIVNMLPERKANSSLIQIKIFNFSKLAEAVGSFEAERLSSHELERAQLLLNQQRDQLMIICDPDNENETATTRTVDLLTGSTSTEAEVQKSAPSQPDQPQDSQHLAQTVSSDQIEKWRQFVLDSSVYDDLQHLGIYLLFDPVNLQFRHSEDKLNVSKHVQFDYSSADSCLTEDATEEQRQLVAELNNLLIKPICIMNHRAVSGMSIEKLLGRAASHKNPERKPILHAVLLQDELHVLQRPKSANPEFTLTCLDLAARKVTRLAAFSEKVVGEEFNEEGIRAVAVQALRYALEDCEDKEANEIRKTFGGDHLKIVKGFLQGLKQFLRQKIAFIQSLTDSSVSGDDIQLDLQQFVQAASENDENKWKLISSLVPKLKIKPKFVESSRCRAYAMYARPLHPHQLVLHCLCSEVNSIKVALSPECLSWPGRLAIIDASSYSLISWSRTFDAGTLLLLPDGVHCVTYRLSIFRIDSGQLVRNLDPGQSVALLDMVMAPAGGWLIAKKFHAIGNVRLMVDFSERTRENFDDPAKVIEAYRISDGKQLLSYLLEEEPKHLIAVSDDRIVLMLRGHPAIVFEVSSSSSSSSSGTEQQKSLQQNSSSEQAAALTSNDFMDLRNALGKALAKVADARPSDPIEFLAQQLLMLRPKS